MSRASYQAAWLIMGGVCGMLLAAQPALAHAGHQDPSKHLDRLTKKLKFTDAQRGQVEQIMNDYHTRAQALHEQFESLRTQKHERIKAVLTPEQQAKFEQLSGKSRKHHWGWHKKKDENP